MRVIQTIVNTLAKDGGTSRVVPAICDAITSRGVDCYLVAGGGRPGEDRVLPSDANRALIDTSIRPSLWEASNHFRSCLDELRTGSCPLVHDHGIWLPNNHFVARYCKKHSLKRIVSPHGMLSPWALTNSRWKKKVAWALYQRRDLLSADVIHATSDLEVDELRQLGIRRPIALIPNGFDFPRVMPTSVRTNHRTALFLSRIHPKKGLINLVRAWHDVSPSDWKLHIVGPDEDGHAAEVEREIAKFNLGACVTLHDALDDEAKWQAYVDADLFILPSFSENFGIVIAEAMAAGLPVITTTHTPWQVLNERGMGWCIPATKESLTSALYSALNSSDAALKEMGEAAKEYVISTYSWDAAAAQLCELYMWLDGAGPRPSFVL